MVSWGQCLYLISECSQILLQPRDDFLQISLKSFICQNLTCRRRSRKQVGRRGGGERIEEERRQERQVILSTLTNWQPVRGTLIGQWSAHHPSAVAPALWSPASPWRSVIACRRGDPPIRSASCSSCPTAVCSWTTEWSHGPERKMTANQSKYGKRYIPMG